MIAKSHESSLGYTSTGNGVPPLVLIQGLTYDSRMWEPTVEILKAKYRCISIDLPGRGKSAPFATYDMQSVTRALSMGVSSPVMVGHSMGAIFAAFYAGTYPTTGLVTVDQRLNVKPFVQRIQSIRDQLRCNPCGDSFDTEAGCASHV
jgi:pimeloyl-ACP methyl ester carboxylesterase